MISIVPTTNYNTNFKAVDTKPNLEELAREISAITAGENILPPENADKGKQKFRSKAAQGKIPNVRFKIPNVRLILMAFFASLSILFCAGICEIYTELEQKGKEIAKIIELVQKVQSLIPNGNKKRIICSDDTVSDYYSNGKLVKSNIV